MLPIYTPLKIIKIYTSKAHVKINSAKCGIKPKQMRNEILEIQKFSYVPLRKFVVIPVKFSVYSKVYFIAKMILFI